MLLLYFIFVHLSLLVPGYVIVKKIGLLRDKPAFELCAAYVVSLLLCVIFGVAGYVLSVPHLALAIVHWGVLLVTAYLFWQGKYYRDLAAFRFPLAVLVGMSFFSLAFISLAYSGDRPFIPDPAPQPVNNYEVFNVKVLNVAHTFANDNYVPYRQAQFFVNRSDPGKDSFIDEWGVHFFQRTPLMGAATAEYFVLFGNHPPIASPWSPIGQDPDTTYLKFQVIAHILNTLFVLPAFLLIRYFFNRRTAKIALLFMIPSQYFLFNTFFSWPKSLVAFFILFSWLLILERRLRCTIGAGVVSGMAYLTHDLAVLYLGATVVLLLSQKRIRDTLIFGMVSSLFALPWLITSALVYKKPSTFIYYPLSIHDIPQVDKRHEIIQEFLHTSPLKLLYIRLETMFYQLSPYQLLFSEGGQAMGNRLWAVGLFSIPGAVGLGLMFGTLLGAIQKLRRNMTFWILTLVPVILCTIVIGWPRGLGALHYAEATVALFMGLGVWFLLGLKSKLWLVLAYLIAVAQVTFFGVFSYNFRVSAWLHSLHDVALLLSVLAVMGAVGWLVWRIANTPDPADEPRHEKAKKKPTKRKKS
jgi:hypothetical protein